MNPTVKAVKVTETDNYYQIDIMKGFNCEPEELLKVRKKTVVLISGECIGSEEPELGAMLMRGFLSNLKNLDNPPETVIFVNNSVRLTTVNEETVPVLKELAESGVEILSCGMCLDFYEAFRQAESRLCYRCPYCGQ